MCAVGGQLLQFAGQPVVMGIVEILGLLAGGFVAGAMNAVAGGGTIVTFPLLMAFGMPSIQANATNTLALLVGMSGSIYGYRSHLPAVRPWLKIFAPVSIAGGLIGALLLTHTSEKVFSQLVPFLIFFATVLFLFSDLVRRFAGLEDGKASSSHLAAAAVLQFFVAVYGGYFGAGIGILMLAALGLIGHKNIHEMNGIKTVLGALINVVAAVYFVFAGLVVWPQAVVIVLGAAVGYYSGAFFSSRISPRQVRGIVVFIGLILSLVFFWHQFLM